MVNELVEAIPINIVRRELLHICKDFCECPLKFKQLDIVFTRVVYELHIKLSILAFFTTSVLNIVILCVILPININFDFFRASSVELKEEYSRQVVDDSEVFKKIQGLYLPEPIPF